jgi:hypothetical protein
MPDKTEEQIPEKKPSSFLMKFRLTIYILFIGFLATFITLLVIGIVSNLQG